MKNVISNLIVFSCLVLIANAVNATTIDFESVASGTQLSNEFESLGVLFSGTDSYAGLVITEGQYGTSNFGNSPNHLVHGKRPETVFPKVHGARMSPTMVQRIAHQVEAKCRDVAPRAYVNPIKEAS